MSVHWPIIKTCLKNPKRVACIDDRKSWKAYEILLGAMHLANHLKKTCKSDTVGVLLPTSGAFPVAALAAWMIGKTVVPLNYMLRPDELAYIINDCNTDTVITVQPMLDHVGMTPDVPNVVMLDALAPTFKGLPKLFVPKKAQGDDLAVLLYTSGTSGKPKGVMLTHSNINSNIRQCIEHATFNKHDVMLGLLPSFHSFGFTTLTMLPLQLGATAVYSAKFEPRKVLRLIREHKPTLFVGIPSMHAAIARVRDASKEDFASFRLYVSGGEPLPDAVSKDFKDRLGITINEGYGLTETSPVTNLCLPEAHKPHAVGPAVPGVETRIVDIERNEPAGVGAEGEIRLKGPNIMKGYYKLPEQTEAAFDSDGYFRTGDIGKLDEDGYLYITGRLKEMLIVGGENVFPREIEEALVAHDSVHAAGVVGLACDKRGEVPIAFVEAAEGATFNQEDVLAWCRDKLAVYKVPKEVRVLEALPRNPTGKIMRKELKKMV